MMVRKSALALLLLGACDNQPSNEVTNAGAAETTDAVTAEAIRDTQAATNDAAAAADAELDRLGADKGASGAMTGNKGDRVRNTTAVTVY